MGTVSGGRLFARALKREGADHIFGLSGGHIMDIFYGCRDEGVKVIDVRHEASGAFAADAHARVTGRPGVVVTTAGPGITNTTTAMAEARIQGVPVIHIGGGANTRRIGSGDDQDLNSVEIMSTVTKWARRIYHTHRIPEFVSMAFREALAPKQGPVYLEIGIDVLFAVIEEKEVWYPEKNPVPLQPFGDPASVEAAADLLIAAERPVVMIGGGARFNAEYGEAIAELAEYLQLPVSCATICRGLFADEEAHPLFRLGGAQAEADVVLMLNVENDVMVGRARPPAVHEGAKLIQVNADPALIGYNAPAHIGIMGGAGAVARQILDVAKSKAKKRGKSPWVEQAMRLVAEKNTPYTEAFASEEVPMNPGRCAYEVSRFLNEEARDWTVALDGGDAALWLRAAATARRPGQILLMGSFGPLGSGPGFGLGAWAANGKPVLYYSGDGSFGFHAMEFDTFCRFGVPVVCVISNDSAWGMIKQGQILRHKERAAKGLVGLNLEPMRAYEKMVAIWDGYGEMVKRPEEIIPAIRRAAASGKPSIINVEVDQVTASPLVRGLAGWE